MRTGLLLIASLLCAFADAPTYTAASIVNAADNVPGSLAPNTIGTVYGTGLAYGTRALIGSDIQGGVLPTILSGTGVRVLIAGLPACIYYVSPGQINFLVPNLLLAGPSDLQVVLDGRAGPDVPIQLTSTAPALFQLDPVTAIATRADGSVATASSPLSPGDYAILYATGLGNTVPPLHSGELPTAAAELQQLSAFTILLDGVPVDASQIAYAGVAPGFAGLYQVNLRLPASIDNNPEIRIGFGTQLSAPGVHLPAQP